MSHSFNDCETVSIAEIRAAWKSAHGPAPGPDLLLDDIAEQRGQGILRDQVLIFSSAERGYLIDAVMVFMESVKDSWEPDQFTELKILLQLLMRTRSDHPLDKFLGKQVTVALDREGVNPDGTAYGSNEVIRGQLLGIGEGGNFEILEDDGFIHYCWPALEIRERDEIQGM